MFYYVDVQRFKMAWLIQVSNVQQSAIHSLLYLKKIVKCQRLDKEEIVHIFICQLSYVSHYIEVACCVRFLCVYLSWYWHFIHILNLDLYCSISLPFSLFDNWYFHHAKTIKRANDEPNIYVEKCYTLSKYVNVRCVVGVQVPIFSW
jgi:hypothetical protein